MKTLLTFILSIILSTGLFAHGGQYRGPRDIVPPGGGGNNPGGPITPGQPGQPGSPTTPPGTPNSPGTGGTPPGTSSPGFNPTTGPGIQLVVSDEDWTFWWEFNKDRYLNIKRHIHKNSAPISGDEEFDLGIINKTNTKIAITRDIAKTQIYPHLINVLQDETRSPDELSSALIATAKLGYLDSTTDLSLELMKRLLNHPNQEVSESAALSIGILNSEKSFSVLRELALDTSEGRSLVQKTQVPIRTRAFSVYALSLLGRTLFTEDLNEPTETILLVLNDKSSATNDLQIAALQALGTYSSTNYERIDHIETFITKEKNDVILAHAYTAYGKMLKNIKIDSYVSAKLELLLPFFLNKKDDLYTRLSKIQFLGFVSTDSHLISERKLETLKEVFRQAKTAQEKYFALISIGQLRTDVALAELIRILDKEQKQYKPWASLGMGVNLYNRNTNIKIYEAARMSLETVLISDKADERKGAYALALGLIKSQDSGQIIFRELSDSNIQNFVGYSALALGLADIKELAPSLMNRLKTSKRLPDQLQNLAIGCALLQANNLTEELLKMLQESKVTSVYASVANALGFVGDAKTIQPLVGIVNNKDIPAEGRAFAIVALGIIGDKSEFNWNVKFAENCNYRATCSTFTGEGKGILDIL